MWTSAILDCRQPVGGLGADVAGDEVGAVGPVGSLGSLVERDKRRGIISHCPDQPLPDVINGQKQRPQRGSVAVRRAA